MLRRDVAANTKGVVFVGTPHRGSQLADYFLNHIRHVVLPSIEVNELKGVCEAVSTPGSEAASGLGHALSTCHFARESFWFPFEPEFAYAGETTQAVRADEHQVPQPR
jgi:hypothetical protein